MQKLFIFSSVHYCAYFHNYALFVIFNPIAAFELNVYDHTTSPVRLH